MVCKIIDSISIKLNKIFGDDYHIYGENVKQGFKTPAFYIHLISAAQEQFVGNRYYRRYPFDILYFPVKENNNTELQDVAEELYFTLEFITLSDDSLLRGTKIHYEIEDGVLHFFVNYNVFVKKAIIPPDEMKEIDINNNIKR